MVKKADDWAHEGEEALQRYTAWVAPMLEVFLATGLLRKQ